MEPRVENLAILYQGALTAAVRIQARRQQIGNATAFRQRMRDVLVEIGREAVRRGYTSSHTTEADFAFVAFLDEVILNSEDPCRNEWAQKPLQEDLFGISTAGEQFFSHLDTLLSKPDTPELADVLEVYQLCLLLGFQGRYITTGRAELEMHADRIRQRMERLRGAPAELAPSGNLPAEAIAPTHAGPYLTRLHIAAVCAAGCLVACFVIFSAHLYLLSMNVNDALLRSVVP